MSKALSVINKNIFDKYEGDAFSNAKLNSFLQGNNITEIEVIGVDGGGCVSRTAIGALKAGYKVILNTSVIGTIFEMQKVKA